MKKNKFNTQISWLISGLMMLAGLVSAPSVKAASVLAIQTLPSYMNTDTFKLSCTSDASSVTFSVTKSGGSTVSFATVDLTVNPCQVQITSSQITGEGEYTFSVTDGALSKSTTTIFDKSGPSPVSDYYKDGLSDGVRIHWTNPSDSDFSKVIIYRGDTPDFTADSAHEITTQPGGGGSPMTYEDHSVPLAGKTFYYNLRAIDKAGNSSSLVGDGGETITVVITPTPGVSGEQLILPTKEAAGSVLGTEASPSPEPEISSETNLIDKINEFGNSTPQPLRWILTHKKISLGIILAIALISYGIIRISKKKDS